jgi:hypothetical protein
VKSVKLLATFHLAKYNKYYSQNEATVDALTVFYDDNGTFSDFTLEAENYILDTLTLPVVAAEDQLYIGYRKPFSDIYFEIETPFATNELTFEYWNGTVWTALAVIDRTNNFKRSGFQNWDQDIADWATTLVNNIDQYWIRISFSTDETLILNGINTVFTTDIDLEEKYRNIAQFRNPNDTSFIATHQAVRKDIIQKIRNQKTLKISSITHNIADIVVWDLLDRSQLKQAAVYYALSVIFFNSSDNIDGKYYQLGRDNLKMGDEAFQTYLLTIDENDDGKTDNQEQESRNFSRIQFV